MARWASIKWGIERWRERLYTLTGAVVTLSTSVVNVCTLTHKNEGGVKMAEYALGNIIRLSANFKNGGTDVDPSIVTASVKTPLGVTLSYTYGSDAELVKDSVGDYSLTYTPTAEGRHSVRFIGTGLYASANETTFDVRESAFN